MLQIHTTDKDSVSGLHLFASDTNRQMTIGGRF